MQTVLSGGLAVLPPQPLRSPHQLTHPPTSSSPSQPASSSFFPPPAGTEVGSSGSAAAACSCCCRRAAAPNRIPRLRPAAAVTVVGFQSSSAAEDPELPKPLLPTERGCLSLRGLALPSLMWPNAERAWARPGANRRVPSASSSGNSSSEQTLAQADRPPTCERGEPIFRLCTAAQMCAAQGLAGMGAQWS